MIDYIRIPLSVLAACMMLGVARADEPGITTLLARAHAEAAAGQLLAPAGDNVLETLMYLKDWVSFTLEQLNEIQTLLDEVLQEEKKNAVKADRPPSAEITLRESYDSQIAGVPPARSQSPGAHALAFASPPAIPTPSRQERLAPMMRQQSNTSKTHVPRTVSARIERSPNPGAERRCRSIVLRSQVGEEPSHADRVYLRQDCPQG